MRLIATIKDPMLIAKILTHLGLPTEPPPVAAARAPPEGKAFQPRLAPSTRVR